VKEQVEMSAVALRVEYINETGVLLRGGLDGKAIYFSIIGGAQ
jgi:hypothetical protein